MRMAKQNGVRLFVSPRMLEMSNTKLSYTGMNAVSPFSGKVARTVSLMFLIQTLWRPSTMSGKNSNSKIQLFELSFEKSNLDSKLLF
mmetsp:Transcript_15481/g.24230  ORF Transcript_15481/g.24230 Transcript_15481/m.24230 type:complete len:87 (+) Transcript_15481:2261-2521(+)